MATLETAADPPSESEPRNIIPPCPQVRNNVTDDNSTYALGFLDISLTQGSYSLTELSDINPLDAGAFLGNIGGFWGEKTISPMPSALQVHLTSMARAYPPSTSAFILTSSPVSTSAPLSAPPRTLACGLGGFLHRC